MAFREEFAIYTAGTKLRKPRYKQSKRQYKAKLREQHQRQLLNPQKT